jgi:hypothetical protein
VQKPSERRTDQSWAFSPWSSALAQYVRMTAGNPPRPTLFDGLNTSETVWFKHHSSLIRFNLICHPKQNYQDKQ